MAGISAKLCVLVWRVNSLPLLEHKLKYVLLDYPRDSDKYITTEWLLLELVESRLGSDNQSD